MPLLQSNTLAIACDERWPRVNAFTSLSNDATLSGCEAEKPFTVQVNDVLYHETDLTCEVKSDGDAVFYTLTLPPLQLTLTLQFALEDNQLQITLPEVREDGAVRLETLYFPEHRLITGYASNGDSYLRSVGWSGNWQRSWCPGQTGGGWEDLGPVGEGRSEDIAMPTHYGCIWNNNICAAIMTSLRSVPLRSILSSEKQQARDRAGLCSFWSAPYYYRLHGRLASPFLVRVAVLPAEGESASWTQAANWQADQLKQPEDLYHETLVYKLFLDDFRLETPVQTFDDCLNTIKRISQVSGGLRQIAYLVGWQDRGHDSGYPWPSVVNPRVGGEEGLKRLVEEAQKYNCIISIHMNVDDTYVENAGHPPELLSRGPDGEPYVWFTNYEVGGRKVYSINHTLGMETGYHKRQLEHILEMVPLHTSIHFDAHRACNEVWFEDGGHIDSECEWQLGLIPIQQWCKEHGMDISVENASPLTLDLYTFCRNRPIWYSLYQTVMTHGRMRFECGEGPEVAGLGKYYICDERAKETFTSLQHKFYVYWMYAEVLHRKKMLTYEIGSWYEGIIANYSDDTYVRSGRRGASPLKLFTRYEGIPIARGDDRFLPWRADTIYAYSADGGEQEWLLPALWQGRTIKATVLREDGVEQPLPFNVEQRTITFQLPPATAARFTLE